MAIKQIPHRNPWEKPRRITQSKEWFEKQYLNDHLNCQQIGDLLGFSRNAIRNHFKKIGIPIRPRITYFVQNGQRCQISQGYFWIYNPNHPRANGQYVKRSVLVLEKKLGRPLYGEEFPHHKDENRMNDHPDNLVITTRSLHMSQHSPINDRWKKYQKERNQKKQKAIDLWNVGYNTMEIAEYLKTNNKMVKDYLKEIRGNDIKGKRRKRKIPINGNGKGNLGD